MCTKYFPQLPEDPASSDTKDDEENEDLFELPPSADSREDDDEEQHNSEDDSSESSGQALEHGSKAKHDVDVQRPNPPPAQEPAESTSGMPSSSKDVPMAPLPQSAPSSSTMTRPKLNDLGLPVGSS